MERYESGWASWAALTSAARRFTAFEARLETCAVSGPDRVAVLLGRAHERSEASYYIRSVLGNLRGQRARSDRGREVRLSRTPLPPNRTGGFPAYGSPVSRFLWTERTEHGLLAGYRDPDRRSIPPLTLASKSVVSMLSVQTANEAHLANSRWLHDRYSHKWHCDRYVALCSFFAVCS